RQRVGQATANEDGIDRLVLQGEDADGDRRARITVAGGDEAAAGAVDGDRLSGLRALEPGADRAREDPRVAGAHRSVAARLEDNSAHLRALAAADERPGATARLPHQPDGADRHLAIDRLAH